MSARFLALAAVLLAFIVTPCTAISSSTRNFLVRVGEGKYDVADADEGELQWTSAPALTFVVGQTYTFTLSDQTADDVWQGSHPFQVSAQRDVYDPAGGTWSHLAEAAQGTAAGHKYTYVAQQATSIYYRCLFHGASWGNTVAVREPSPCTRGSTEKPTWYCVRANQGESKYELLQAVDGAEWTLAPALTLLAGTEYQFELSADTSDDIWSSTHPFQLSVVTNMYIKASGAQWTHDANAEQGSAAGQILKYTPNRDVDERVFYRCVNHANWGNSINILYDNGCPVAGSPTELCVRYSSDDDAFYLDQGPSGFQRQPFLLFRTNTTYTFYWSVSSHAELPSHEFVISESNDRSVHVWGTEWKDNVLVWTTPLEPGVYGYVDKDQPEDHVGNRIAVVGEHGCTFEPSRYYYCATHTGTHYRIDRGHGFEDAPELTLSVGYTYTWQFSLDAPVELVVAHSVLFSTTVGEYTPVPDGTYRRAVVDSELRLLETEPLVVGSFAYESENAPGTGNAITVREPTPCEVASTYKLCLRFHNGNVEYTDGEENGWQTDIIIEEGVQYEIELDDSFEAEHQVGVSTDREEYNAVLLPGFPLARGDVVTFSVPQQTEVFVRLTSESTQAIEVAVTAGCETESGPYDICVKMEDGVYYLHRGFGWERKPVLTLSGSGTIWFYSHIRRGDFSALPFAISKTDNEFDEENYSNYVLDANKVWFGFSGTAGDVFYYFAKDVPGETNVMGNRIDVVEYGSDAYCAATHKACETCTDDSNKCNWCPTSQACLGSESTECSASVWTASEQCGMSTSTGTDGGDDDEEEETGSSTGSQGDDDEEEEEDDESSTGTDGGDDEEEDDESSTGTDGGDDDDEEDPESSTGTDGPTPPDYDDEDDIADNPDATHVKVCNFVRGSHSDAIRAAFDPKREIADIPYRSCVTMWALSNEERGETLKARSKRASDDEEEWEWELDILFTRGEHQSNVIAVYTNAQGEVNVAQTNSLEMDGYVPEEAYRVFLGNFGDHEVGDITWFSGDEKIDAVQFGQFVVFEYPKRSPIDTRARKARLMEEGEGDVTVDGESSTGAEGNGDAGSEEETEGSTGAAGGDEEEQTGGDDETGGEDAETSTGSEDGEGEGEGDEEATGEGSGDDEESPDDDSTGADGGEEEEEGGEGEGDDTSTGEDGGDDEEGGDDDGEEDSSTGEEGGDDEGGDDEGEGGDDEGEGGDDEGEGSTGDDDDGEGGDDGEDEEDPVTPPQFAQHRVLKAVKGNVDSIGGNEVLATVTLDASKPGVYLVVLTGAESDSAHPPAVHTTLPKFTRAADVSSPANGWFRDLFVSDCNGAAHLFPNHPLLHMAVNNTLARQLFSYLSDKIVDRAKCRCAAVNATVTDEQIEAAYSLDFGTLLRAVEPPPRDDHDELLLDEGDEEDEHASVRQQCQMDMSLDELGSFFQFDKGLFPHTCTAATWHEEGQCAFKMPLPAFDLDIEFALAHCPGQPAASLPYFSLGCRGDLCNDFMKPCESSSDCDGSVCTAYDGTHDLVFDFIYDSIRAMLDDINLFPTAEADSCSALGDSAITGANVGSRVLNTLLTSFAGLAKRNETATTNVNGLRFCGLDRFGGAAIHAEARRIADGFPLIGQLLAWIDDIPGVSEYVDRAYGVAFETVWPLWEELFAGLTFEDPMVWFGALQPWDGTNDAQVDVFSGANMSGEGAYLSSLPDITASIPSLHDDPSRDRVTVVAHTCSGRLSLFPGSPVSADIFLPNINFALDGLATAMKSLIDCRTFGKTPLTWAQFRARFAIFDPAFWLNTLTKHSAYDEGTSFPSGDFADSIESERLLVLPESCSFESWHTEGKCTGEYTGFNDAFPGYDFTMRWQVTRCAGNAGLPSFFVKCVGAHCQSTFRPYDELQRCTQDSNCGEGDSGKCHLIAQDALPPVIGSNLWGQEGYDANVYTIEFELEGVDSAEYDDVSTFTDKLQLDLAKVYECMAYNARTRHPYYHYYPEFEFVEYVRYGATLVGTDAPGWQDRPLRVELYPTGADVRENAFAWGAIVQEYSYYDYQSGQQVFVSSDVTGLPTEGTIAPADACDASFELFTDETVRIVHARIREDRRAIPCTDVDKTAGPKGCVEDEGQEQCDSSNHLVFDILNFVRKVSGNAPLSAPHAGMQHGFCQLTVERVLESADDDWQVYSEPDAATVQLPGMTSWTPQSDEPPAVSSSTGSAASSTGNAGTVQSDVNTLTSLRLADVTLSPAFSKGNLTYSASVPNAKTSVAVTVATEHSVATVVLTRGTTGVTLAQSGNVFTGDVTLLVGNNKLTFTVSAENGARRTYVVNLLREAPSDDKTEVTTSLKLDMDLDNIPDKEQFKEDFKSDLVTSTGLAKDQVTVNGLRSGSIIVDFTIKPKAGDTNGVSPTNALAKIQQQLADPTSPLRNGKVTGNADPTQTLTVSYKCDDGSIRATPCANPKTDEEQPSSAHGGTSNVVTFAVTVLAAVMAVCAF